MHDMCRLTRMSTLRDWIPSASDFATRLVLVRHQMGWNLKEAALACGVKAQSWREWELENRKPRDYEGVCRQISESSGCSLVWLMTGVNQGPPPDGGGRESHLGESNPRPIHYEATAEASSGSLSPAPVLPFRPRQAPSPLDQPSREPIPA